jgi:hypothetical protein
MEDSRLSEKVESTTSWRVAWPIVLIATAFVHEFRLWKISHIAILEHMG